MFSAALKRRLPLQRFAPWLPLAILAAGVLAPAQTLPQATGPQASAAAREHLVWSDEFSHSGAGPDPANWGYETGGGGWGNGELETYCSPGTPKAPCDPAQPNAFVASDGYLHIVARRDAAGKWTSGRLLSKGLQSFQYGRVEARIRIPAGPGVWPAFWMLGADIDKRPWPACGELDIMENIGKEPTKVHGSVHGPGFIGTPLSTIYEDPAGQPIAAEFHNFGMIWSPGKVQYYVDDPAHPYATYTPADLPPGAVWPFDQGRFFVLFNLAIGGTWPGPPTGATVNPAEMLVDYVRVYETPAAHAAPASQTAAK